MALEERIKALRRSLPKAPPFSRTDVDHFRHIIGDEKAGIFNIFKAYKGVLTPRESEILFYVSQGAKNATIGDALCVQMKTIKWHMTGIMRKLEVSNRTQAALHCLQTVKEAKANEPVQNP